MDGDRHVDRRHRLRLAWVGGAGGRRARCVLAKFTFKGDVI
jgi:hypothetical protein